MELKNGDIIKFISDPNRRNWVLIDKHFCKNIRYYEKYRKHIKDHTGFYIFSGLWYSGNALTDEPYGKCLGQLKVGDFANMKIVGNISNKTDYLQFIKDR